MKAMMLRLSTLSNKSFREGAEFFRFIMIYCMKSFSLLQRITSICKRDSREFGWCYLVIEQFPRQTTAEGTMLPIFEPSVYSRLK